MTADQINAGLPVVVGSCIAVMWVLESLAPLVRTGAMGRARHLVRNARVIAVAATCNIGFGLVQFEAVLFADRNELGLLQWLGLGSGGAVAFVVSFVMLDLLDYLRHRVHHHVPVLWRLHQVHHLDEAVDVTTGYLNHPLETVPIFAFTMLTNLALGFDPLGYAARLMVGLCAVGFHHSNLRLAPWLDRALAWITPTPGIHRAHHARSLPQTNTNYGTIFTLWDRLFGTFHRPDDPAAVAVGLDAHPVKTGAELLRHPATWR